MTTLADSLIAACLEQLMRDIIRHEQLVFQDTRAALFVVNRKSPASQVVERIAQMRQMLQAHEATLRHHAEATAPPPAAVPTEPAPPPAAAPTETEPAPPAAAGAAAAKEVQVRPWDLVLHSTESGGAAGYVSFRCTVGGQGPHRYMGAHVKCSVQDEWSFPVFSAARDVTMVDEQCPELRAYMRKAAKKGGRYVMRAGELVGDAPQASALLTGLASIGSMRAADGTPDPQLRAVLEKQLNLETRKRKRERAEYGDTALEGVNWALRRWRWV